MNTKADKIFDIAEKLGYEGDTEGSTADAINAVSDALGFDGPHKSRITSALTDLYTVVGGGGGVGPLVFSPIVRSTTLPVVDEYPSLNSFMDAVWSASIGDAAIYQVNGLSSTSYTGQSFAAGVTVAAPPITNTDSCILYRALKKYGKWAVVEQLNVELTKDSNNNWVFVVPEVDEPDGRNGEESYLYLYMYKAEA